MINLDFREISLSLCLSIPYSITPRIFHEVLDEKRLLEIFSFWNDARKILPRANKGKSWIIRDAVYFAARE